MNTHGAPDYYQAAFWCLVVLAIVSVYVWYRRWLGTERYELERRTQSLKASASSICSYSPQYEAEQHLVTMDRADALVRLNERLVAQVEATQVTLAYEAPAPTPTPPAPPIVAPAACQTPPAAPAAPAAPAPLLTFTTPRPAVPTVDFSFRPAAAHRPPPTGAPRFHPGEPETLDEYTSQQAIVRYLKVIIQALATTECATTPLALTGPAGTGKTALMKAFANSLRLRNLASGFGETDFIELFPNDVKDRTDLERVLRRASHRPTVLRIDELHTLDNDHAVLLFELLAEGAYRFAGDTRMTPMDRLTIIAATTDWARLHSALRRRFAEMPFEPLTPKEIAAAVQARPFAIAPDALTDLVSRTQHGGVLWEALRLFEQAERYARAEGVGRITTAHLREVYDLNQLDNYGLTAIDRRILKVMFDMPRKKRVKDVDEVAAYGGSELNVSQVAALDLGSFREIVKPKLLSRGLITTRSPYGQVLTDKALQLYGSLKDSAA